MILKSNKFLTIFFVGIFFNLLPQTSAEKIEEGIFIETLSELNDGRLTLDAIRTRPTTLPSSSKKISIESDGYYIYDINFKENSYVAQDRARLDARRLLSEQASIYVKSISTGKNGKLTRDEIHTISVLVLQIENESMSIENLDDSIIQYHCHIKALLSTDNIFDKLDSVNKEQFKETVLRTIESEKESARLNTELAKLKQKYQTASKIEREKISDEIKLNEENFTATMWNEKGFEFYGNGDFKGALDCFNKTIKINPNYAAAWNGLGCIANYEGNFDRAVEYCYKSIEIDENSSASWNNLGYAYQYKGNLDKAIECYERAIDLDSKGVVAQINLGNVYDALKNYDEAIKCYQKALEISPNYVNAFNGLGYVYIQKEDFDNGIEYCKKAIEFDPNYAAAWNGLAYSYNQKKKFYKAVECCRKAIALSKNYANAWNNLGYACSKISRYEDSFIAYRNAVKYAPNVKLYMDNLVIAQKRIDSFKSL